MRRVTRSLGDLLSASDAAPAPARAYLHREPVLRDQLTAGDRMMYIADRDVCPPRQVRQPDGTLLTWRIDRVTYPAGDLPSGELNRSVGHWNPADQWEIFEVEAGEVALVLRPDPRAVVEIVTCGPGAVVPAPPGGWHVTYVVRGPAVVSNIYSAPAPTALHPGKYFSRSPVRLGLARCNGGLSVFADPPGAAHAARWRSAAPREMLLGPGTGEPALESLFAAGPPHALLTDPARHCSAAPPGR